MFDPLAAEPAARLAVALGIGLLLGAERERRMSTRRRRDSAGLRTFALVSLVGGIAQQTGGTPVVVAALAIVGAAAVVSYARSDPRDHGMTTEVALLVAFLLGVLAQTEVAAASALAVAVTILLAARATLHRFVSSLLTDAEVHDALLFAAAAVVILPLLPDRTIGPFDVLNPFAVWRLVVLLMGIGAAGYVAVRTIGPRYGMPMAGFAGGFVSSTATIASMGATARRTPALLRPAVSGAVFSTVATVVQMGAVVGVSSAATLSGLDGSLLLAGVGACVYAAASAVRSRPDSGESPAAAHPGHAFDLRIAVVLALVITGVTVVGAAASDWAGERGVAVAAALGGFADTHAAAIGVASLVGAGRLSPESAVVPILLALTTNTVSKIVFAYAAGGRRFTFPVAVGLAIVIALAWVGHALIG